MNKLDPTSLDRRGFLLRSALGVVCLGAALSPRSAHALAGRTEALRLDQAPFDLPEPRHPALAGRRVLDRTVLTAPEIHVGPNEALRLEHSAALGTVTLNGGRIVITADGDYQFEQITIQEARHGR